MVLLSGLFSTFDLSEKHKQLNVGFEIFSISEKNGPTSEQRPKKNNNKKTQTKTPLQSENNLSHLRKHGN